MSSGTRLLLIFTFATALMVGVIAALATGSWWLLAVALLIHACVSTAVLIGTGRALSQEDKPDPVTEAHEAAAGSSGPESPSGGNAQKRGGDERSDDDRDEPHMAI